jgi:TolA-binding protein
MTCQQCQDLLLLYATAALDPAEAAAVRAHLATGCPACAGELAAAEAALHKMPLALPPQHPPESAWEKLETRIALKEQAEGPGPDRAVLAAPFTPRRRSPFAWTGWVAAAVSILILGLGWKTALDSNSRDKSEITRLLGEVQKTGVQQGELQGRLADLERQVKDLSGQSILQLANNQKLSTELQDKIDTLLHSDQFAVTSPEQPTAAGKLYWNKQKQVWNIYLDNVTPAAAGKTYELWIVSGTDKLAAGTAQVDDQGRLAFQTTRKIPDNATLAAITDEATAGEPDNGAKGKIQFLAKLTN